MPNEVAPTPLPQGPGKAEAGPAGRVVNVRRPNGELAYRATARQVQQLIESEAGRPNYSATGKLRYIQLYRSAPVEVLMPPDQMRRLPMTGDPYKALQKGGTDTRRCGLDRRGSVKDTNTSGVKAGNPSR